MMKYRYRPNEVEAIQLSDGSRDAIEEWDEVSTFLGLPVDPTYGPTGKGEHVSMRRPPLLGGSVYGNVIVDLLDDPEYATRVDPTDWIVRTSDGALHRYSDQDFKASFEKVPQGDMTDQVLVRRVVDAIYELGYTIAEGKENDSISIETGELLPGRIVTLLDAEEA